MGIIRMIKKSDYDFIYNSMVEYGELALIKGYEKAALKVIMENKCTLTLVYEEENMPLAYEIVITKPRTFMESFYKELSLLQKIKYSFRNKINTMETKVKENVMPCEIKEVVERIYMDDNPKYSISLFLYSKIKKKVHEHLAIAIFHVLLKKNYLKSIATIRKTNELALYGTLFLCGDSVEVFDYDSEIYVLVTDLEKFLENKKTFNFIHEVQI